MHLLLPNTSISDRNRSEADVMLILRYFPHASVVRFFTTGVVPSSLTVENTVLSVLVERRSALWTERLRTGISVPSTNVILTLSTHHPWGMSRTTKGLVLSFHTYSPLSPLVSPSSKLGQAPPSVSHVRSPLLTLH